MKILVYLLLGIILSCLTVVGIQYYQNSHLETDLSKANTTINELKTANDQYAADNSKRQEEFDALKKDIAAAHARADAAEIKANKISQKYNVKSKSLDSIKFTGDDCKDTFAVIDAHYRGLK